MSTSKIPDQTFTEAVQTSFSVAETLRRLGLDISGGNYKSTYLRVRRLGINTGHWLGKGSNRGRVGKSNPQFSLPEILIENSTYSSGSHLKKRLIREGLLQNKCQVCGIHQWMGSNLSLQLDQINGKNSDNRIENLRLLCPNCHSQTPTFAGRKLKQPDNKCRCGITIQRSSKSCGKCHIPTKKRAKNPRKSPSYRCACGQEKSRKSRHCKVCADAISHKHKIHWPDVATLLSMLSQSSFVQVAKTLGVSDTGLKKHLMTAGVQSQDMPDGRKTKKLSFDGRDES